MFHNNGTSKILEHILYKMAKARYGGKEKSPQDF
jgi:hypothetical protein